MKAGVGTSPWFVRSSPARAAPSVAVTAKLIRTRLLRALAADRRPDRERHRLRERHAGKPVPKCDAIERGCARSLIAAEQTDEERHELLAVAADRCPVERASPKAPLHDARLRSDNSNQRRASSGDAEQRHL